MRLVLNVRHAHAQDNLTEQLLKEAEYDLKNYMQIEENVIGRSVEEDNDLRDQHNSSPYMKVEFEQ